MTTADQTAGAEPHAADADRPAAEPEGQAAGASGMSRPPYAEVLRESVDWLWQTDADLTLTYVSYPLSEERGGPSRIWLGRSLLGLAHGEADAAIPSPLLTALKDRRAFRDCTVDWTPDSEQTVRFRLTGLPFYDRGTGGFAGYRGTGSATTEPAAQTRTARDLMDLLKAALSERDALQRQLAEAGGESLKERLSAIAHELRTPLNAIIGFSELIRDQAFGHDPKRYAEYGGNIHKSGLKLLQLINRILDTAEQQSGVPAIAPRALDLGEVAETTRDILSDKAAAAGVTLSLETAADLPRAFGDRQMTGQILFHLLSRCLSRAEAGWHAGLLTEPGAGGAIEISVWDAPSPGRPTWDDLGAAPEAEEPEDLGPVVLAHLAQTMGAELEVAGRAGRRSCATLRLPTAPRESE